MPDMIDLAIGPVYPLLNKKAPAGVRTTDKGKEPST
jgi:hypothetical protein